MTAINPNSKWTRSLIDTSDSKLNLEISVASPNIWLCVLSSIGILRDVSEISHTGDVEPSAKRIFTILFDEFEYTKSIVPLSTNSKSSTKENPKQWSCDKSTTTHTHCYCQTRTPLSDHDANPDHVLHIASIEDLEGAPWSHPCALLLLSLFTAKLASRHHNLLSAPATGTTSTPSVQPAQSTLSTLESDSRPKWAVKVPMKQIKGQLGYDDAKWNTLQDFIHTALTSAHLDWCLSWKAQWPDKIAMAYNAIEEAFPETTCFAGQWGVDWIAKLCWDNHKNYHSCIGKPTTYCGRQAAARHAARAVDAAAQIPSRQRWRGVYYDDGDGPEEDVSQLSEKGAGKCRPKYEFFGLPVSNFLLPPFPTAPGVNYDTVRPMIDNSLDTASVNHLLPTWQSALCNLSASEWCH
ncbi:hypothetical protein DFH08DRAFT_798817 [Mycena albidolilacea]|uniref:Uncharacterized protein n=1 Tax=Mycena albidolilacea TaxID=1033008 RepID=A0AAD7F4D0_9AGAR|nr:hypothetical protein DFH08DRAFT_798817 [Mycena albidolilacea]